MLIYTSKQATLSNISSLLYLGHGRHKGAMLTLGLKDNYVGRQAQTLQGILNIRQPFKQGSVQHWDDLELLWKHVWQQELKRLRVSFNYRGFIFSTKGTFLSTDVICFSNLIRRCHYWRAKSNAFWCNFRQFMFSIINSAKNELVI